mgnify:FL=1
MAFSYIWVGRAGLDFPPVGVARIGLGHYLLPGWAERALIFPRGAGADKVGALSSTWVGRAGLDFSPWGAAFIFVSRRMRVKGLVGVDDSVHEMPCASLLEERSSREQEVPWDPRIATERPWNAQERSGARAAANSP